MTPLDLERFRDAYIAECLELLAEMEELLPALDVDAPDPEQINAIFRAAHSVKGGSGAFGLDYITDFTHVMEALLDAMRDGRIRPARETVDTLLLAVDVVGAMVRAAKQGVRPPAGLGADVMARLRRHAAPTSPAARSEGPAPARDAGGLRQWRIDFAPHAGIFVSGNEPLLILRELAKLGNMEARADASALPPLADLDPERCYLKWRINLATDKPEAAIREAFEFVEDQCELTVRLAAEPGAAAHAAETKPAAATSVRIELAKLDKLVNMVGELVITESALRAQVALLPAGPPASLMRGIEEFSRHTRELQEAVMAVRMQPVKSIFSRMPRIVRDLSAQLGKDIRLETSGENTEIDKTVIEQLSDPLTHMIRNSADHGVERPEERLRLGKPAHGTIRLAASHQGGRIVIEIEDDGAGVNRPKALAKAKEKGLVAPDAALSDEECDRLIFLPGFSTADAVSNVSGRGVGMDVVRRNIESLGGTVRLATSPGKGSLFTVSLPLTLAILDGMIVRVGGEHYIVPIAGIVETLRPSSVRHVEGSGDVIHVRGEFVPLVYLHRAFGVTGAEENPLKALAVLAENGREKIGLVVDELIGQQQVVIKSLEENSDAAEGISGATILGDGKVSLILDVPGLCRMKARQGRALAA